MYKAILEAGIVVEHVKHEIADNYHKAYCKVYAWVEDYDKAHPVKPVCDRTIICEANRHKHNCASTDNYRCACWKCSGSPEPFIEWVQ